MTPVGDETRTFVKGRSSRIIFVGAAVLRRALGLAFLGLMSWSLTPADISRFGLFTTALLIGNAATINIAWGLQRTWFDHPIESERLHLVGTALRFGLSAIFVAGMLTLLLVGSTVLRDPLTQGSLMAVVIILVTTWFGFISQVGNVVAQNRGELSTSSLILVSQWTAASVGLGLSILCGVAGFWAAIGSMTLGLACAAWLARKPLRGTLGWNIPPEGRGSRRVELLALLTLAAPGLVVQLGWWALGLAPRWVASTTLGLEAAAGLTLASMLAGSCAVVSYASFNARMKELGTAAVDGDEQLVRRLLLPVARNLLAGFAALHLLLWAGLLLVGDLLPEHLKLSGNLVLWSATTTSGEIVITTQFFWLLGRKNLRGIALVMSVVGGTSVPLMILGSSAWGLDGILIANSASYAVACVANVFLIRRKMRPGAALSS